MSRPSMQSPDLSPARKTCIVIEVRDEAGQLIASAPLRLPARDDPHERSRQRPSHVASKDTARDDAPEQGMPDNGNFYSILM